MSPARVIKIFSLEKDFEIFKCIKFLFNTVGKIYFRYVITTHERDFQEDKKIHPNLKYITQISTDGDVNKRKIKCSWKNMMAVP